MMADGRLSLNLFQQEMRSHVNWAFKKEELFLKIIHFHYQKNSKSTK